MKGNVFCKTHAKTTCTLPLIPLLITFSSGSGVEDSSDEEGRAWHWFLASAELQDQLYLLCVITHSHDQFTPKIFSFSKRFRDTFRKEKIYFLCFLFWTMTDASPPPSSGQEGTPHATPSTSSSSSPTTTKPVEGSSPFNPS